MISEKLKYFELAKKLNAMHREELVIKEAHFRGSMNSCSLISLNHETAEIGESGITEKNAARILTGFNPKSPGRPTPEKTLQAWIILNALRNNHILPFGDNLTFITSELASVNDDKTVNDILSINETNDLVVIELKPERINKVKQQALKFKDIILSDKEGFFKRLTELMTGKDWSGKVICAIVWPKAKGKARKVPKKYMEVGEYQYIACSGNYTFE